MRAVDKFGARFKFSTYATWWIYDYPSSRPEPDHPRSGPHDETMSKVRTVSRSLSRTTVAERRYAGRPASIEETSCVLQMSRQPLSLDQPVNDKTTPSSASSSGLPRRGPAVRDEPDLLKSRIAMLGAELSRARDHPPVTACRQLRYGTEEVHDLPPRERVRQIGPRRFASSSTGPLKQPGFLTR